MGDKSWARVLEKRDPRGVLESSNGSSRCVEEDCWREVLYMLEREREVLYRSVMSRDVGEKFWRRIWIERVWRDL